jgi:hypothetical protein
MQISIRRILEDIILGDDDIDEGEGGERGS